MGVSLDRAPIDEGIRRRGFDDVPGHSVRSELSQQAVAELLGTSERTFSHWHDRRREAKLPGLADRQRGPSMRQVPGSEIERMPGPHCRVIAN